MRRTGIKIISIITMAGLLLSGCANTTSSIDMDKIAHIGENLNKISENVASIDTEALNESVEGITESTEDLTEWADVESEIDEEAAEELIEEVEANMEAEDITLADIIDEEAAIGLIEDALVSQMGQYAKRGQAALRDALMLKDSGMAKIMEGIDILNEVYAANDFTGESIDDTFAGAQLIIEGTNEITQGATILINEGSSSAKEVIEEAKSYGVTSKELDELEKQLAELENVKLSIINENAYEELEEAREALKNGTIVNTNVSISTEDLKATIDIDYSELESKLDKVEDLVVQADKVVVEANKMAGRAQELYDQIASSAKKAISESDGLLKGELDIAKDFVAAYEANGGDLTYIPTSELKATEEYLNEVIDKAKKMDYEELLSKYFAR